MTNDMNDNRIGTSIAFLRKRAGYTQKDLADRIGISDKAVSKWERGIGLPDIGYLRKLSILLDTDTDSLLSGNIMHHDSAWSGVLVMNSNEHGIGADTNIYDKPLISYLLSYFLLVGIKEILVVCTIKDEEYIRDSFGSGEDLGISIITSCDGLGSVKQMVGTGNTMMVYDYCLIYGVDQTRFFQKAMANKDRFTMLVLPKKITNQKERVLFDHNKKVIYTESDEKLRTQYDFTDIPILFFPSSELEQIAKEKDVASYISHRPEQDEIYVEMLDRGFVDIRIDSEESVKEASDFFRIVQDRCGMNVYCIEEVAWRRGMITLDQLRKHGEKQKDSEYGKYILSLCNHV